MTDMFSSLSDALATGVERAAAGVVQVQGHRRPAAAIVFAPDLLLAPAQAVEQDTVSVLAPSGQTHEGLVLGRALTFGLSVVRVNGLGIEPLQPANHARVGQLALAIGRTWSGSVMASVTNIAVIGGPLRTSRVTRLEQVIRIAQSPHGALVGGPLVDASGRVLGVVTDSNIRRTTVVIPAAAAWSIAHQTVQQGGTRQGFLGVGSTTVRLRGPQRSGLAQEYGLLVTSIVDNGPADQGGVLIGDIIVSLGDKPVQEPEALIALLRRDEVGNAATLGIIRGTDKRDIAVTVGERPVSDGRRARR